MKELHRQLVSELTREQRRTLLELIDTQDAICEEQSLKSFVAGFRLAWGIVKELDREAPYSYELAEEERVARYAETAQQ